MSIKIGFAANNENENKTETAVRNIKSNQTKIKARKSIVDVFFPERKLTCSYFNDKFDLKCGDIVYVDGKLEGKQGRVVGINYNFKIKLSDYKKVISVANTDIKGEFFLTSSQFVSSDRNALPYEQIITWFRAPISNDDEIISSSDDTVFCINSLEDAFDRETAEAGFDNIYFKNRVVYIELNSGKVRAIVQGEKCTHEIEFNFDGNNISALTCNCYSAENCKHEFAVIIELKEVLKSIEENYPSINTKNYISAVNKALFFQQVIKNAEKGSFKFD